MSQDQFQSLSHLPEALLPTADEPDGILVAVKMLRRNGQRISKDERAATDPLVGRMIIQKFAASPGKALICRLQADLYANSGGTTRYQLHKPLFDPEVIHMDEKGIVFRGFEIGVVEGMATEFAQLWLVTPLPTNSISSRPGYGRLDNQSRRP